MNRKTRDLAKLMHEVWCDEVATYAPAESSIQSFDDARQHWMRKALKEKKTLAYRKGLSDWT